MADVELNDSSHESVLFLGDDETRRPAPAAATPLPVRQLAALCGVRLIDPIAFSQVFPYVNEMIDDLRLTSDPSRIGFYSGLVESTFAISQLFSIYHWARLSDHIGRRPVIIMGILGVAITTMFLGFSQSLIGTLSARFLAGLGAGNSAVVHSVLGEITDASNQALAFPIYGLCWPLGAIVGPMIGGAFSHPAEKYPALFDYPLLRTYPYLLPGMITAAFAILGAAFGYFFLEETLPSERKRPEKDARAGTTHADAHARPPSMRAVLRNPAIRALSLSGAALSFIQTAYDVVFVLFCYTPVAAGGLAFSSAEIGYCLSLSGAASIAIQIAVLPPLLRRARPARIYAACMHMWPLAFLFVPVLSALARRAAQGAGTLVFSPTAALWIGVAVATVWTRVACLAYSVNMILLRDHAPSPAALGTTNGLAQLFMSLARAFSPAFVSSLFALSLDAHVAGGHAWVAAMVGVALLGVLATRRIARVEAPRALGPHAVALE